MPDNISYRHEAESENLNSNKKEFLSILPVGSGYVFLFFFSFLALLFSSLFYISIPVKIQGKGFFVSGYQQSPVTFNEDNYLISDIFVSKSQALHLNQDIMMLSSHHKPGYSQKIASLNHEINQIRNLIDSKSKIKSDITSRHENVIEQHEKVVLTISKQLWSMKKTEAEEKNYFEKGLSTKKQWQEKKEMTQSVRIKLEETKQYKIEIEQEYNRELNSIDREIDSLKTLLNERNRELSAFDNITIKSPCDCEVGEIFVKENNLTEKDKVLLTLLKNNPGREANVYIASHQYRPIEIGSRVLIKPDAYPTLKYGSIHGKVTSISESTFSGKHYPELFKETDNYFKITVDIEHIPEQVKLQTGMEFKSEIILEHLTLFNFIFE